MLLKRWAINFGFIAQSLAITMEFSFSRNTYMDQVLFRNNEWVLPILNGKAQSWQYHCILITFWSWLTTWKVTTHGFTQRHLAQTLWVTTAGSLWVACEVISGENQIRPESALQCSFWPPHTHPAPILCDSFWFTLHPLHRMHICPQAAR